MEEQKQDDVGGRVIQARGPLEHKIVDGLDVRDSRLSNYPRPWIGAPSREFLVIRQNAEQDTGERSLDLRRRIVSPALALHLVISPRRWLPYLEATSSQALIAASNDGGIMWNVKFQSSTLRFRLPKFTLGTAMHLLDSHFSSGYQF